MINSFVKFQLRIVPLFPACFVILCPGRYHFSLITILESSSPPFIWERKKERKKGRGKKRMFEEICIFTGLIRVRCKFLFNFFHHLLSVKRSCSVNPQVRIGKLWKPRGVAYGVAGGSLFKTPMRFLFNPWIPVHEFYRKPCPNWRFILCHRAADQSNRIKNNENLSNQKYIYIYISPHLHFVNLRQPPHRVLRLLFSFFPPCSFRAGGQRSISFENRIWWRKIKERAPLASMWDTQRKAKLSINLCIKKLIFTLYETNTSNPAQNDRNRFEKTAI